MPGEVETLLPLQRAVSVTTPAVYGSTSRPDGSVSPVVSSIPLSVHRKSHETASRIPHPHNGGYAFFNLLTLNGRTMMTSKKTRSKHKKARFFGRAFEQVVPTNSEPVAEEFPIQQDTPQANPSSASEYVIEDAGLEADSTPVYLQRFPWLVDLPIDKLEKGQSFLVPFDKFNTDPVIASSRSFNSKMVERARSNMRMYMEVEYKHLTREIGLKTLKEKDAFKVFRRTDVSLATVTNVPSTNAATLPTLTTENRVRIIALAKNVPFATASGIVNDIVDAWFEENAK